MMKSHDKLPMASPLIPKSVMISRAESSSIVFPLCRRLETTGYFTRPPLQRPPRKYSAAFHLVEKKRRLFLALMGRHSEARSGTAGSGAGAHDWPGIGPGQSV